MQIRTPSRSDDRLDFEEYCKLISKVNGLKEWFFSPQDFIVSGTAVMIAPNAAADSFPWGNLLFGYSISGADVTIKVGEIHWAKLILSSTQTTLTIGADLTYVYVRMEYATHVVSILQTTSKPASDDSYFCKWLYLFNFAGGSATLKTIGHMGGAIDLFAGFAP